MFQPHGRCSVHTRPCERNSGQKAANWNHRKYNSAVYSRVGMNPPISVPQYGTPLIPVFTPTETCVFSVSQVDCTSPDHRNEAYRCMPA